MSSPDALERPGSPGPRRAGGRPRHEHVDALVLAAALEELADKGVSGVTVQAVARRAGVARGSVTLRWRDREELLLAALATTSYGLEPPTATSLPDVVEELVRAWADKFREPRLRRLLTRLKAERDAYPAIWARYLDAVAQPAIGLIDAAVVAAQRRGEARADIDAATVRLCLLGALWMYDEADAAFEASLTRLLVAALTPA